MYGLISDNELYHHGILGMKWGVRRYQNEDGTLTEAGKRKYGKKLARELNREDRSRVNALTRAEYYRRVYSDRANSHNKLVDKIGTKAQKHPERMERYQKKLTKSLQRTTEVKKLIDDDLAKTSAHENRMNELMKDAESKGIRLDKRLIAKAGYFDGISQYQALGVNFKLAKVKPEQINKGKDYVQRQIKNASNERIAKTWQNRYDYYSAVDSKDIKKWAKLEDKELKRENKGNKGAN